MHILPLAPAAGWSTDAAPVALPAGDVNDVTVTSGSSCISVLLPTEPAPGMTRADLDRVQRLVAEVDHELHEHGVTSRERLLQNLADQMRGRPRSPPTGRWRCT